MDLAFWACFLASLLLPGTLQASFEVTLPILETAPRIDGVLREKCWSSALTFRVTKAEDLKTELVNRWNVYLGCDETALYVGIETIFSGSDKIARFVKKRGRDGPVWKDDCFEIMIDYRNRASDFVHLLINPRNEKCDFHRTTDLQAADPGSFDGDWTGACQIASGKITVEFKVPYAIFDLAEKKDKGFRINVGWENKSQGEHSSLAGAFFDLKDFIVLKNLPIPESLFSVKVAEVALGTDYGPNFLITQVGNLGSQEIKIRPRLEVTDGKPSDFSKKVYRLGPSQKVDIRESYYLDEPAGERELKLHFVDEETGSILRTVNKVFFLKPALSAFPSKYSYDERDYEADIKVRLNLNSGLLAESWVKIFLQRRNSKEVIWEKKGILGEEISAIVNITRFPFGITPLVIQVGNGKERFQTTIPLRKVKGPFFGEQSGLSNPKGRAAAEDLDTGRSLYDN